MHTIRTPNGDSSSVIDVTQPGDIFELELTTDPVPFPSRDADTKGGLFEFYVPAGHTLWFAMSGGDIYFPIPSGFRAIAFDAAGEIQIKGDAAFTAIVLKNKEVV